jgi:ATPase subunit of ABC transporter with duplicated ATPase domains
MRIALIGNAGCGKSTLFKHLAEEHGLRRYEVDALQWNPDWTPTNAETYNAAHAKLIAEDAKMARVNRDLQGQSDGSLDHRYRSDGRSKPALTFGLKRFKFSQHSAESGATSINMCELWPISRAAW